MPKSLFKISRVSSNENRYQYLAEVDPSSHILKGHFEQMAVVPGVCTLTMLKQCVADIMCRDSVQYDSIKECKFLATILPEQHRQLYVNIEFKGDNNIAVEVLCGETKMMKLKAIIAE